MHAARFSGDADLIELLVRRGADPDMTLDGDNILGLCDYDHDYHAVANPQSGGNDPWDPVWVRRLTRTIGSLRRLGAREPDQVEARDVRHYLRIACNGFLYTGHGYPTPDVASLGDPVLAADIGTWVERAKSLDAKSDNYLPKARAIETEAFALAERIAQRLPMPLPITVVTPYYPEGESGSRCRFIRIMPEWRAGRR